jgi:hypothetical protein
MAPAIWRQAEGQETYAPDAVEDERRRRTVQSDRAFTHRVLEERIGPARGDAP